MLICVKCHGSQGKVPWKLSTAHLVILPSKWTECLLCLYLAMWLQWYTQKSIWVVDTGVEKGWPKKPDIGCCFVIDSLSLSDINSLKAKACFSSDPWCLAKYLTWHLTCLLNEWMSEMYRAMEWNMTCRVGLSNTYNQNSAADTDIRKARVGEPRNFLQWPWWPKVGVLPPPPPISIFLVKERTV